MQRYDSPLSGLDASFLINFRHSPFPTFSVNVQKALAEVKWVRYRLVMDHEAEYREATKQAQRALDRMKRANERGTGCYLTAEMIESLAVTKVGELWEDELSSEPSR